MSEASAFDVRIVERRTPAPNHVELIVESRTLAEALPGQFCHVLTPGTLRRPISFSRLDPSADQAGLLLQVVGSGTEWLYQRRPREWLNVMGPLGRGFTPPEAGRPWLLLGGGVGIPPVYAAYAVWQSRAVGAAVILGARTAAHLIMADDFRRLGLEPVLTTDDGSQGRQGTVIEPARAWLLEHPYAQVTACGPTPMLAALYQVTQNHKGPVELALEQRMGCGIGACRACVVPAPAARYRRVCTDGPVFRREELVF